MVQQDSIAVILLNSNFAKLTTTERASQQARYTAMLVELDTLAAVRTVIVCCHHSPYSDSKLVGSNTDVQDAFVAPFMRCTKALLFITGHAHLFQHFGREGKHFLVIGGGPATSMLMTVTAAASVPFSSTVIFA